MRRRVIGLVRRRKGERFFTNHTPPAVERRSNKDLVELVVQLAGRFARYETRELHTALNEARESLISAWSAG